ncbi:Fc.00g043570.m01.CDS01 [Cosmosporella sp. VM-42]
MAAFNDLALHDDEVKSIYSPVWAPTYNNAPANNPGPSKRKRTDGAYVPRRFANHFYDDEGWSALAWIVVLDNTGVGEYPDEAIEIWDVMNAAWNKPACGGLLLNKDENSGHLAISNELFIQVGAALANRVGDDQNNLYLDTAKNVWQWFQSVGIINSNSLVNGGISNDCINDGQPTYTYTQGSSSLAA